MARKKGLAEIKALSSKSKQPAKSKYANTKVWEAWEEIRDEGWQLVVEGSLEECFESLYELVHWQIDEEFLVGDKAPDIEELEEKYGHLPDGVLNELLKKSKPYLDAFKTQCLEKGECQGWKWLIAASPSKLKRQIKGNHIFAYSPSWQVWEVEEDGSEGDLFSEGGLKECLEEISFVMSGILDTQYHEELREQGKELEPASFFEELGKRRSKVIKEITESCLKKGKYKSQYWDIFSEYSKEECREIKASGEPSFF
jgi:hypothetical protein